MHDLTSSPPSQRPRSGPEPVAPHSATDFQRTLEWALGCAFTPGNRVDPLVNGDEIFPAMLASIEGAKRSVAFASFVYWTGEIAERFTEALARAAERGVEVMVVIDAFGGWPMRRELARRMEDAGVQLHWFRPLYSVRVWRNTHRTHRKILVVDHEVGFTGGVGIAEEWTGDARGPEEWRDTHFRIRGPAVIGLWAAFAGHWMETTGALPCPEECHPIPEEAGDTQLMVVRGTSSIEWSDIGSLLDAVLTVPRRRLWLTTAYFVPDEASVARLKDLAGRGVDVRVMMPCAEQSDERLVDFAEHVVIRDISRAGIRIFRFQPTMLHTKTAVVDEDLTVIGSANLNHRSVHKDDEVVVVALDPDLNRTLAEHFERDEARCCELTEADLQHRPWWHRLLSRFSFRLRAEL